MHIEKKKATKLTKCALNLMVDGWCLNTAQHLTIFVIHDISVETRYSKRWMDSE